MELDENKKMKTILSSVALKNWLVLLSANLLFAACGGEPESPPETAANPAALTRDAEAKQQIGAYEEAVTQLNAALIIDPDYIPAHYRMGSVYEEWDKRREAVAAYKKALALDPNHEAAHMGLGSVYAKMTKNELTIEEYKKVAAMKPGDPVIHFKIALEYWYLLRPADAAEHYRKAIKIDPDYLQAHLNLASVYERLKEWDLALAEIEASLKLARARNDQQAISIAESKQIIFKGRMNVTAKDWDRKSQPPFE